MYKPHPEFAATLASCGDTKHLATDTAAPGGREVNEGTRRALLKWAGQQDRALNVRLDQRYAQVAARARVEDPREIRELQERRRLRSSRAFTCMVELLLETDCSLREVWALRWTDVELTERGLQIWIAGRTFSILVEEGFLDGVPQLSQWVFEGTSWARIERAWRSIGKRFYLPSDIFS